MSNIKLNLGCQDDIKKGFINVDNCSIGLLHPESKNKIIDYDLNNFPLPWKDNSVSYINCEHLIYYLNNPKDFLLELWRICKPNANIKLIVTHFSLPMNYAELDTKKSGYSYFMLGEKDWNKKLYNKFKVVNKKINYTRINHKWLNYIFNPLINTFPLIYERFFCYMLPCSEIIFDLEVIK